MDTNILIGVIGLVAFLILLFCGLPVSFSMMAVGVFGSMFLLRTPSSAFSILSDSFLATFTGYTTAVAPMFMLMGDLAGESGLGSDLFGAAQKLVGHKRGGLASAVQFVCALFGAICGSAGATAAMMGRVAYPEMKKYGYKSELSTACIASGASLSILIPPSLPLITYGIVTEESIGQLFVAGILVGIVLMVLFIIAIRIWASIDKSIAPVAEKAAFTEKIKAIRRGGFIELLLVFGIAMGGLFAGWFTPTEAGAVGIAGMSIVCIVFNRFSFRVLKRAITNTMVMSAMIYLLLAGSTAYGRFFTLSRIPMALGSWVTELALPPVLIVACITIMYLILGCVIDAMPLMLLTIPMFYPIVTGLGYSGLWFGVFLVVVVSMGAVTPPVGMSCYIVSGVVKDVPLQKIFKGSWPFVIAFLVMCLLLAIIPEIATRLPSLIG